MIYSAAFPPGSAVFCDGSGIKNEKVASSKMNLLKVINALITALCNGPNGAGGGTRLFGKQKLAVCGLLFSALFCRRYRFFNALAQKNGEGASRTSSGFP